MPLADKYPISGGFGGVHVHLVGWKVKCKIAFSDLNLVARQKSWAGRWIIQLKILYFDFFDDSTSNIHFHPKLTFKLGPYKPYINQVVERVESLKLEAEKTDWMNRKHEEVDENISC